MIRPDYILSYWIIAWYIGWLLWEKELDVLYQMLTKIVYLQNELPEIYLLNQVFR